MTEKAKPYKMPEVTFIREENTQMAPVTGVFGTLGPDGGQMTFFHDTAVPEISAEGEMTTGSIERHVVLETHMSPQTFVSIAHWMMRKTQELERLIEEQNKYRQKTEKEE